VINHVVVIIIFNQKEKKEWSSMKESSHGFWHLKSEARYARGNTKFNQNKTKV
jgi:hypothetical protein